jgi:hypothetical protein
MCHPDLNLSLKEISLDRRSGLEGAGPSYGRIRDCARCSCCLPFHFLLLEGLVSTIIQEPKVQWS